MWCVDERMEACEKKMKEQNRQMALVCALISLLSSKRAKWNANSNKSTTIIPNIIYSQKHEFTLLNYFLCECTRLFCSWEYICLLLAVLCVCLCGSQHKTHYTRAIEFHTVIILAGLNFMASFDLTRRTLFSVQFKNQENLLTTYLRFAQIR